MTAREAADAMAAGVARALPDAETILRPVADGGEGTTQILLSALGGTSQVVGVSGPLEDDVDATFGRLSDGTTIVEAASASGLALLPEGGRHAPRASSIGTGELLRAALAGSSSSSRAIVGVGGTATTDGGTGAASAFGWRFVDEGGDVLTPGGGGLCRLARIEPPEHRLPDVTIVGACDVDSPLTGPGGAARVFARQKGASDDEVELLEEGLVNLARRVREDLGLDLAAMPHAGAGGGLAAGIVAFLGGTLEPGFTVVADTIGLDSQIGDADLAITGEGRLDEGSLRGKCTVGVGGLARAQGVACGVIAGEIALGPAEIDGAGFDRFESLIRLFGPRRALDDPAGCVTEATRAMVASMAG